MPKYIMAFDLGTTSCRTILFDQNGAAVSSASKQFAQIFPKSGWVEHDPMEIWSTQVGLASEAMYKINAAPEEIAAIGITNQRETTLLWDKETGKPVYNAIVWQCRRTAPYCDQLKAQGLAEMIKKKTGLLIDPYFCASKIKWILDHVGGAREDAEKGRLLFGTVDSWILWNLTGGKVHATDYSNASRTMLFNLESLQWDPELLSIFQIPECILPTVCPSSYFYGETLPHLFGRPIPICAIAGDQQSALFGQLCTSPSSAKCTYGTGAFLLMNTGSQIVHTKNGLLTTIAWGLDQQITYALEGSIFNAGSAVQWLRDEMQLISSSAQSQEEANKVPDSGGVYVVPAFSGIGAPYWDPYARGTIVGLTRDTGKSHIIRATLESIAYQVSDVLELMTCSSGLTLSQLQVDGGASANDFLLQFQADIIGKEVVRPDYIETTARGAAFLAGLNSSFYRQASLYQSYEKFHPNLSEEKRQHLLDGWKQAVERSLHWART